MVPRELDLPRGEEEPVDDHVKLEKAHRPLRRFLVAKAPYRGEREAPSGAFGQSLPTDVERSLLRDVRRGPPQILPSLVSVLPWSVDRPWLSIIVRTAWRFDLADKRSPARLVAVTPRKLRVGTPSKAEPWADDFVPIKRQLDLTLTGHVELLRSSSGEPRLRRAALGLGERVVRFVVGGEEAGKVRLVPPHTRSFGGHDVLVGPVPCHDGSVHGFEHEDEFDIDQYQTAPPELRFEAVENSALVRVTGLFSSREELSLPLPPLAPGALLDYTEAGSSPVMVELALDTLNVDLDTSTMETTYRGHAETTASPRSDVDRIVVGFAERGAWVTTPAEAIRMALRELPRGTFGWAWEREDVVSGEAPPPLSDDDLAMARYETWDQAEGAEPTLPLPQAAVIAAELLEPDWPRSETLARHGLDEYTWAVEERAWAEHLSMASRNEDDDTAARYAAAFESAQESLATQREKEVTLEEYAVLSVAAFRGDPAKPLAEAGLGLGGYMRVEKRFRALAAGDPTLQEELSRLQAAEEARLDGEDEARERAEELEGARPRKKGTRK